jgi:D-arabinose 1-dehydrogenase-like Zn-dependent alcohol dehydrogenase
LDYRTRLALGLDYCPEGCKPEEMRGREVDFAEENRALKAVMFWKQDGPENLRLEEVPDAKPGPRQVVVQLKAAALNQRDVWIRSGRGVYAGSKVPMILGSDGAGEVVALGLAVLWLGH